MPASVRTLSQLPGIVYQQLDNKSKFEVSVPVELSVGKDNKVLYKFASKSITAGEVSKKMLQDVRNDLIAKNGLSEDISVSDLCTTVSAIISNDFTFYGDKKFLNDPKIDNSPLSSYSLTNSSLDSYSVNYETLKRFSNINSSPTIGPNFGFVTRLSAIQGNSQTELSRLLSIFKPKKENEEWTFAPEPYFVFDTNAKNTFSNEYVFKIERGARESKPWIAPASGIFTCYGWLDEINNPSQSNESRWVALMGKQSQLGLWTILQVQPFIKNNYLSYVGFTFPVRKGMELKIVTGFAVGGNSDKYFASNSSIANHVGNAFLGGVYTGLSAWNERGENYSTGEISNNNYITSADMSAFIEHESECDLSVKGMVDFLSATIDELSDKIDDGGKTDVSSSFGYIDTEKLSAGLASGGMDSRILYFGSDARYNGSVLIGSDDFSKYYVGTEKTKSSIVYNGHFYKLLGSSTTHTIDGVQYIRNDEKVYQLIDGPYGGENAFYTDDYFWYYTVSRDVFAHVQLNPDLGDVPTATQCYLRYLDKNGKPYFKTLASVVEYGGTTDNQGSVTIPLKRGSTLAFGAYIRRQAEKSQRINFTGKTYDASPNKKTVKIKKDSGSDTARDPDDGSWPSAPSKISISLLTNMSSSRLVKVTKVAVASIYVSVKQTAGKCFLYARLTDENGKVVGGEKYLNSNNKTADLVWTNVNFDASKKLIIELAYNGLPQETTTTQVWVKKLDVTTTYIESSIDTSILGAPCPVFNLKSVDDLIAEWKPNGGTATGQIIKPHDRPSWFTPHSAVMLASVTAMTLYP